MLGVKNGRWCWRRIILGEDQPFMEILHEVLRNYGKSVAQGHRHIYQSMPRMLTIWFEYGNYCAANPAPSGNKASLHYILSPASAFTTPVIRQHGNVSLPRLSGIGLLHSQAGGFVSRLYGQKA